MKSKINFFRFSILLFSMSLFITTYYSCRKIDSKNITDIENINENAFFKMPANSYPILGRIANEIKLQNNKYHFLAEVIKKEGIPIWSKAKILVDPSNISRRSTTNNNDSIVLIPLSLPNKEWVTSFLACKVNDTVSVNLYRGSDYKNFGYQNNPDSLSAEKIAQQIMFMEYDAFGHDVFIIRDKNLFNTIGSTPIRRYYKIRNTGSQRSSVPVTMTVCNEVWVDNDQGQVHGCPPDDPNCLAGQYEWVCSTYTFWANELDTGGGGQNTGGGTTGGGWLPGPSGGGGGSPTVGTGGWVSYSFSGAAHLDTWQITIEDGLKINNWKNNSINSDSLDTCRKQILNKLLNSLGVNVIGRILTKMDRSINEPNNIEKFNIKFTIRNLSALNANAAAANYAYNTTTGVFSATIIIDSTVAKNSTDIFIAGRILHETIHVYMKSLLFRIKAGVTFDQIKNMSYDSVFTEYVDSLVAREARRISFIDDFNYFGSSQNHNFMANKLIDKIAEGVQKFDDNRINDSEYYWYTAWSGLYKTKQWLHHWPNYYSNPNWPIVGAPLTTNDSTRGLKYALTPARLQALNNALTNEDKANNNAKGKKPITNGCY
jgi:hypothetical protein